MNGLFLGGRVRFDRNELSGAFGDIGTDLPLIIGMVAACGLDPAGSLLMFGLMQIVTGVLYGIPMPVQPLKAMAVLMISQKLSGGLLYGAGLSIGLTMALLTLTGALDWIVRAIPKSVVRGIQFGLGLSLASLAVKTYVITGGAKGYVIAAASFVLTLVFIGNKKYPPAIFVVLLGIVYAAFFSVDFGVLAAGAGLALPSFRIPAVPDIVHGFLVLAIPQLALSISNSVIATKRTVDDLFPEKALTVRKIGWTYTAMNLVNPFFGGIPTCHGAGGIAGHYGFGGRTGGSVVIYGALFAAIGLFFSGSFAEFVKFFPLPVLGVILLFESLSLLSFISDVAQSKKCLFVSLVVAVMAFALPYGYAVGLVTGLLLDHFINREKVLAHY
ncbi:MAG: transporter [Elusimicrobia bacterium RIFCSPLOWO2_02_FULL_61_11]|nr:MAG: transporter [Elusimicrobia bacterium RIFCSPLOWO2_02_FULL_61_11]